MNNTINRIKKRADTLTEYIVERAERLEKENRYYEERCREERERGETHFKRLIGYTMPFNQTLNNIESISKDTNGTIIIKDIGGNTFEINTNNLFYPLIEKLLKDYEDRGECLKAINKAKPFRIGE